MWQDGKGNNILHLAAAANHISFISKVLSTQDTEEVTEALLMKDSNGLIPYHITKDKEIQKLLAWAETQIDCYPLVTPPRIVIFFSDEDRSRAQEECDSLLDALPMFRMTPVIKLNPTENEIFSVIRENQEGDISALIIVMMTHGDSGVVKVHGDRYMSINSIIKQMNSSKIREIPKVNVKVLPLDLLT